MKSIYTTLFLVLLALMLSTEAKAQSTAEAIIIEQPNDVIECEGSLDQYLFVVAAPSQKQFKIAYRWLKDGRAISSWVEDFGQLTFDTLRYRMSGLYNAELFAFDPNWVSPYGSAFSYDSARVSPIISSEKANLYVLQPPSFVRNIEPVIAGLGSDISITFDAHIYGEHNMEDPTYWTDIQWFKDSVKLVDSDRIFGVQSSILTINSLNKSDYSAKYRVRLSGDCDTIWSNEFAIKDGPQIDVEYLALNFSTSACITRDIYYSVGLETKLNNFPLEYQFYKNGLPIYETKDKFKVLTVIDTISGFTKVNLLIEWNNDFETEMVQEYYCEIWPKGFKENKYTLQTFTLNWVKPIELITDLQETYTIEEGQDLELSIETRNKVITYNWYKDDKKTSVFDSLYTIKNIQLDQSGKYQVRVKNDCDSVLSRIVEVIVTPKPIITGIKDNFANQEISIYPNPLTSNSTLTLNPKYTGKVSVILADVLGNKLATVYDDMIQASKPQSINLNIDNIGLSSGTYYIIIQMGDKVQTRQVSVVR